jgi:D-lactate dehydrogenase (cytochrome)
VEEILTSLRSLVNDKADILISLSQRQKYSHDKSSHAPTQHLPFAVILPTTPEITATIVEFCFRNRIPMTVRGAGTGLEGGCIPYMGGIVICTDKLRRIEIDVKTNSCWVGAGIRKLELDTFLKKYDRMFGPDPSSNPSVGGMVSTGGSGMTTLKYGTTRENIIALRVVTPEGKLIQTRRAVRKSSTGLDLTQLYAGAEGTLGVVVEILVKLLKRPSLRNGALIVFATTEDAVLTVADVVFGDVHLQTLCKCELLNGDGVRSSNRYFKTQMVELPTLLIEFVGDDLMQMKRDWENLLSIATSHHCLTQHTRYTEHESTEFNTIWEARRGCYISSFYYRTKFIEGVEEKDKDKVYIGDVCVPTPYLARCLLETEKDFESNGFPCIICAHIADGNFHCLIPYSTEEEYERVNSLVHNMVNRALDMGGTVSGEHGVGIGKVKYLVEEHGHEHCLLQKRIKNAIDSENLFNGGGKFYIESNL